MQRGDKLAFAGNLLIEACTEVQKKASADFLHNKQFAKEFCTIRLAAGRRAGHDYSMARIIRDNFARALVVSNSPAMSEIARRECMAAISAHRGVFAHLGNIESGKYDGLEMDAVFINAASAFKPVDLDKVYERTIPMLASKDTKFWILIG
jgi:hypothetical protein